MKEVRRADISWIRFIAMLCIVSCHILQGLEKEAAFWLNVGVQIFFVVSRIFIWQERNKKC